MRLLKERMGWGLPEALEQVTYRTETLKALHPAFREAEEAREWRESTPEGWRAQAREQLDALDRAPVALEAHWDGDTTGWFLVVDAILPGASPEHPRYTRVRVAWMRGKDGDFRLFTGAVPPWPESQVAREIGRMARERWGIPFHFPSPDEPSDTTTPWWDLEPGPGAS
ncbi:hypothetical protein [Pyxidicoccus fallax]|nr:hypothetical protein [Pyxidicoccus fallax]